jgi:hypothetical protein
MPHLTMQQVMNIQVEYAEISPFYAEQGQQYSTSGSQPE